MILNQYGQPVQRASVGWAKEILAHRATESLLELLRLAGEFRAMSLVDPAGQAISKPRQISYGQFRVPFVRRSW